MNDGSGYGTPISGFMRSFGVPGGGGSSSTGSNAGSMQAGNRAAGIGQGLPSGLMPTEFSTLTRSQTTQGSIGGDSNSSSNNSSSIGPPQGLYAPPQQLARGTSAPTGPSGAGGAAAGYPTADLLALLNQGGGSVLGAGSQRLSMGGMMMQGAGDIGSSSSNGLSLGLQQQQSQQQQQQQQSQDRHKFDLSDFPALSGISGMTDGDSSSGTGTGGNIGGGNGYSQPQAQYSRSDARPDSNNNQQQPAAAPGTQQQQQQQQSHGFAMQSDDFPALPGSGSGPGARGTAGAQQQQQHGSSMFNNAQQASLQQQQQQAARLSEAAGRAQQQSQMSAGAKGNNGQQQLQLGAQQQHAQQQQQQQQHSSPQQQQQPAADGSKDYSLTGLLRVIRMTDPDLNMLALGSDLTTLGLNLDSSEVLYSTFASPWADAPSTHEPQFQLPMCYYIQPPSLKTTHFSKFQLETLFYIFYAMPQDVLQAYAAQELYHREWRFHTELKLWVKRATPAEMAQQPGTQFIYFDHQSWERRAFSGTLPVSIAIGGGIASGLMPEEEVTVKPSA